MQLTRTTFEYFLEASSAPVYVCTGKDLVLSMANSASLKIWGKDSSVLGKRFAEALPELKGQLPERLLKEVYLSGSTRQIKDYQTELVTSGKIQTFYFEYTYQAIRDEQGQTTGVLCTAKDVTQLVDARKEIVRLKNEFKAADEKHLLTNQELAIANAELTAINDEFHHSQQSLAALNTELEERVELRTRELNQSERRTREMINLAPVAMMVVRNGNMIIESCNQPLLDMTGKDPSIIGQSLFTAMPVLAGQPFEARLRHTFRTGEAWKGLQERVQVFRNGMPGHGYYNLTYSALLEYGQISGLLLSAADVTEQVMAQQVVEELNNELASANAELNAINEKQAEVNLRLQTSQDELQLAIEAASLATFDLNPFTGRFTGNELLRSWFGLYPGEEIALQKATDVIDLADRERVIRTIKQALDAGSGGNYDTTYTIINPGNPAPRIVRAKGKTLFNAPGEPIRMSGVLQDITEQKADEQRKNDFISIVSHELKTPLTSLSAYVQMLHRKAVTSRDNFSEGALDKANKQIKKMYTLINGFLNVSRLESGKIQIDKQRFDMADLMEELKAETLATITSHVFVFTPVEQTFVHADRDKIGQVMNNFISNAVKYSPPGSTIEIACMTKNGCAEVSVRDSGMGISQQDSQKLFERYYRVEGKHMQTISGFGIGLYLCAEIISRHEGKIWVQSEPGLGSTFHFSLPVISIG